MVGSGKRIIKQIVQWSTVPVYRNRPLAEWPSLMGRLHYLTVPRGMVPNPSPQPLGTANINTLIYLIEQTRDVPGEIAECGVHKGGSLVPMAIHVLAQWNIETTIGGSTPSKGCRIPWPSTVS